MYDIDTNAFMNWVVGIILAIGTLLLCVAVIGSAIRSRKGRGMSYLYMFAALFACFGIAVVLLGFRGQSSGDRPWHFLFDMKYQPKYTTQGASEYFPDGRSMRLPPDHTIPFDGTDFGADAGFHPGPKADFLKADLRYYRGIADVTANETRGGRLVPKDPEWKDGKLIETYYVGRIPERSIEVAAGWEPLLKRGKQQFNIHCAACHGSSGRGGSGTDANGIVGASGMSVAPADVTATLLHSQPDGQLYNTIANGKGQMPGYGHQVKVQDRWAVVAYVRILQYARK